MICCFAKIYRSKRSHYKNEAIPLPIWIEAALETNVKRKYVKNAYLRYLRYNSFTDIERESLPAEPRTFHPSTEARSTSWRQQKPDRPEPEEGWKANNNRTTTTQCKHHDTNIEIRSHRNHGGSETSSDRKRSSWAGILCYLLKIGRAVSSIMTMKIFTGLSILIFFFWLSISSTTVDTVDMPRISQPIL